MANRPHKPTDKTRGEVQALSSFGVPQADICTYIGVTKKTLLKYYRDELDTATTAANAQVAKFLFQGASGKAIQYGANYSDCYRAAMFWLKTRARWSEKQEYDLTSSDGSMTPKGIDPSKLSNEALRELVALGDDSNDNSD